MLRKKKVGANGELDENVFDITTGVSINIFVKNKNNAQTVVNYVELLGKRNAKYN